MPTIDVNGTSLWVEDTGGPGEVLALSHGLLWSARMFEAQIAALRKRFRVIAWDHRGQGRSADHSGHSVSIELVTADALALLDHLHVDRAHFAGLSMGGFVGMRLASRHPERIASLLLMETTADPEPTENIAGYKRLNFVARHLGVRLVAGPVMKVMFAQSSLRDPALATEREAWRRQLLENRRSIWRAVNGVIERHGVYDELGKIRCPTTVIVGDEDTATVPAKAERIVAAIPGAVLRTIPRAGHSSSMEQPAAVLAAMEDHFARLAPG